MGSKGGSGRKAARVQTREESRAYLRTISEAQYISDELASLFVELRSIVERHPGEAITNDDYSLTELGAELAGMIASFAVTVQQGYWIRVTRRLIALAGVSEAEVIGVYVCTD